MPGRHDGAGDVPALGAALALLRERAGVPTQEALARKLGVSSQSVSSRETGGDAKWSTIERTLEALGMTVRDLDAALCEVRGDPTATNGNPAPLLDDARSASSEMKARHQAIEDEVDRRVARIVRYMLGLDTVAPAEVEEILEEVAR